MFSKRLHHRPTLYRSLLQPACLSSTAPPPPKLKGRISKLLIANRGEIAIRIAQAASSLSIKTLGIFSPDDKKSLHTRKMDDCVELSGGLGLGAAAYIDLEQIVSLAKRHNCDAIHPGYGFLSENASFASLCEKNNLIFVGPSVQQLLLFGNKSTAKQLAQSMNVPILPGTGGKEASLEEAESFFRSLPAHSEVMIKAVAGGGGKGMRIASRVEELSSLMERCSEEARHMFGCPHVCVEQYLPRARHVEVQVLGDGDAVCHLFERECTVQRSHQKMIEIAPSPFISEQLRQNLFAAALKMATHSRYCSLGTFEFLVDSKSDRFYFLETNPRLQVEHTVTEEITGVDLVAAQLHIAQGVSLADALVLAGAAAAANLPPAARSTRGELMHWIKPKGFALQARVNMEYVSLNSPFPLVPSGGNIEVFEIPSGRGIRVDSFAYAGYQTSSMYDSLLAKLIVHSTSSNFVNAVEKTIRALMDFRIEGFPTNIPLLLIILQHPDFQKNALMYTRYVDDNLPNLARLILERSNSSKFFSLSSDSHNAIKSEELSDGSLSPARTQVQGSVIEISAKVGQYVEVGQQIAVIEAMKMEHLVLSPAAGIISAIESRKGDIVTAGATLCWVDSSASSQASATLSEPLAKSCVDLNYIRPDLSELQYRHSLGLDKSRPESVAKRHKLNNRTARENLADLYDADSFVEYGALAIAAQRQRRKFEDLVKNTPADGLVAGIGSVNGKLFPQTSQCIALSYDYMVLAGTQGIQNHRKTDRMFEIAEKLRLPIIFLCEGGGGRPGDTDSHGVAGLDCLAFMLYSKLSGVVPRIGIGHGRCFAGNAALLGSSDVVIATKTSNIGMGGPAMIEGGGLGVFAPEEIGPASVQARNGVIDILVDDEAEAISVAKKYLSYFQGTLAEFSALNQFNLRHIIPENRLRVYDTMQVLATIADEHSILELRSEFGKGMITAFARIEGRTIGILANNNKYLSGAIDSDGADKASRFMQLCDAFDIPILSLIDTPGIMVGPDSEKTALVRHASRIFVTSANLSVPIMSIVLRKSYGLGAMAMAGGSFKSGIFCVSWPTGEFGGMGLEGAVKLGFKKELDAIADLTQRQKAFEGHVASLYEKGKAVNYATYFEIDNVIDPADSRLWISSCLKSIPHAPKEKGKRNFIDTW